MKERREREREKGRGDGGIRAADIFTREKSVEKRNVCEESVYVCVAGERGKGKLL